ncbi:hypothetical protein KM043_002175 [Ampulex compressa]|nr:hypothetical protein KM043_002175 [Ampulex compressa]
MIHEAAKAFSPPLRTTNAGGGSSVKEGKRRMKEEEEEEGEGEKKKSSEGAQQHLHATPPFLCRGFSARRTQIKWTKRGTEQRRHGGGRGEKWG